jgi:hypothetical protein
LCGRGTEDSAVAAVDGMRAIRGAQTFLSEADSPANRFHGIRCQRGRISSGAFSRRERSHESRFTNCAPEPADHAWDHRRDAGATRAGSGGGSHAHRVGGAWVSWCPHRWLSGNQMNAARRAIQPLAK